MPLGAVHLITSDIAASNQASANKQQFKMPARPCIILDFLHERLGNIAGAFGSRSGAAPEAGRSDLPPVDAACPLRKL